MKTDLKPKYKRIVLKLSGEALAGDKGFGLDEEEYETFTDQVFAGLAERGWQVPRSERYQIGVTIGVHTGPTPLGVGVLRRTALSLERSAG